MIDALAIAALHSLPAAMQALPQWLVWRLMPGEPGKKPRKVPFYVSGTPRGWPAGRPRDGVATDAQPQVEQGHALDRAALTGFAGALAALAADKRLAGIGFAFLPGDGLIGIDIDGAIDADGVVSARCQAIIDACASYTELSPSGTGVHIIVAGETPTFKDNSVGVEVFCGRQFFTCTGRAWPGAPAEVAPIAEATLRRLKATVAEARKASAPKAAAGGGRALPAPTTTDLTRKLELALSEISPDMHHDEWVVVGMALKHALGEAGLALWEYWSSKGGNVASGDVMRAKWASFKGSSAAGTATEATIFKMAMDRGWKPPKPPRLPKPKPTRAAAPAGAQAAPARDPLADESLSTPTAGSARDADEGAGDPEAPPAEDDDAGASQGGEKWRSLLLTNAEGAKKDCRENVFTFLTEHPRLKGLVAFDEFSYRIVKLRQPPWTSPPGEWTTDDDYELGLWLAQTRGVRLTIKAESTLAAGVAMAANRARFHPVRDYLATLAWDGTPRLAHWLHECMGADDTTYAGMVGRWFLMGMVARVQHPGCQMDNMIVLEGAQGKKKSSALRVLAGAWFADTPVRLGDKDSMLNLAGVWLYEVAELDAFNKAEVTAVKQYVSSRVDRVREPYSRRPVDRKRSCVLGGTTNQHEYFKDSTGSRRFWPVACDGEIDLEKLAAWRDQLFAEALHELARGERYHPSYEEATKYILPEQESREITDPWFERIAIWVDTEAEALTAAYTSSQILTGALYVPPDRIDNARQMATRVGIVMRKLGWPKVRDSAPPRLWRYWRPKDEPVGPALAEQLVEAMGSDGTPPAPWSADEWEGLNAP